MRNKIIFALIFVTALALGLGLLFSANGDSRFVVVLDPGHGGKFVAPKEIYGDKYNPISRRYADVFRSGAYSRGLHEHEEVYAISKRAKEILKLTHSRSGRKEFHRILKKYSSNAKPPTTAIDVHLSRDPGYADQYEKVKADINGPYRMFDYPDVKTGKTMPGRLTRINRLKPHLVVSVHLNGGGTPPKQGAVGSVITPSHKTFKLAIDYVRGTPQQRTKIKNKFMRGPFRGWMNSCSRRSTFQHFLCDAWIYYTGYWSQPNGLSANREIFRGYRHNLLSWRYQDKPGWITQAKKHKWGSAYSRSLKGVNLNTAFWQRERRKEEVWRREKGPEGPGGDNLYASNEILRYVRKGLLVNKVDRLKTLPKLVSPFLSTWTVPTYINAVSAFLEIGYLSNRRDYYRVLHHREVYAESIAVGIYSLFYSLKQSKWSKANKLPFGQRVDFAKYRNYFKET